MNAVAVGTQFFPQIPQIPNETVNLTRRAARYPAKQRALMLQYNERVLDEEAHYIHSFWWNRLVPLRSYVHGWKIGPSHYSNQDLPTIWLCAPECGACSEHPTMEKAEAETGK